jgi:stage IV sporulation protein FB
VNLAFAAILAVMLALSGLPLAPTQDATVQGVLGQLLWINVGLAAFNLLPAFPMDGGRVFRALVAMRAGRQRATEVAAIASKLFAALFVIVGLGGNLLLSLIGVFVWFAAGQEAASVAFAGALSNVTVGDAMLRDPRSVDAGESVDRVAERIVSDGFRELAVFEQGKPAGIVTSADGVRRMMSAEPHGAIGSLVHRDVPVIAPSTPLASVLQPLEERGAALVVDESGLVGLLTLDQVATYAALHGAA